MVGLGISEPSTGRYLKWFLMLQPWRSASWRFHWYLRARCLAQRYRMGCLGEGKDVQQQNAGLKQLKLMATSSEFYFKGQQKGLEDSCEVLSLFCLVRILEPWKWRPFTHESWCWKRNVKTSWWIPTISCPDKIKTPFEDFELGWTAFLRGKFSMSLLVRV